MALSDNLIAHYLLEDNANDSLGTYDGTPNNGVVFNGTEAVFDGADDNISIPILGLTAPFTVSLWMSSNDTAPPQKAISYNDTTDDMFFQIYFNDGPVYAAFGGSTVVSGFSIPNNEMINTVITCGDGYLKLYVNGTLEHSESASDGEYGGYGEGRSIGSNYDAAGHFLDGTLKNVRIYTGIKYQSFIDDLYSEGYTSSPPPTDYIAYYKLENNADDETGNHNGTVADDVSFNGEAAQFDGYLDHIETRSITETNNFIDLSISCWFTLTESKAYSTLFGRWDDTGTLMIRIEGTTLKVFFYSDGGFVAIDSYSLSLNTKYYFAMVHSSNTLAYYIDSVMKDRVNTEGIDNLGTSPQGIEIGGYYTYDSVADRVFSGNISNFRVYDYGLTNHDIENIYTEEGDINPDPDFIKEHFIDASEDLVLEWNMFQDLSIDLTPTYETFTDVSEDGILIPTLFQDISLDHQGYIQIFTDISSNNENIKWSRFYDISGDEIVIQEDTLIKRITE